LRRTAGFGPDFFFEVGFLAAVGLEPDLAERDVWAGLFRPGRGGIPTS
jgi:hypothetical protein